MNQQVPTTSAIHEFPYIHRIIYVSSWSNPMAVQKSRVTPSRRGQRRSHDALTAKQLATDPTSGEVHLRHHITKDGYYRGRQVIAPKVKTVDEE